MGLKKNDVILEPLVSIVVITYNSSQFVLETLESAKAQTYKNIELIISDDCSTDDTVKLCEEWLRLNQDRFVHSKIITTNKNSGTSANCNRGVKATQGEWIKLIAGDDLLLENCIKDNIDFVQDTNVKIVFSNMFWFKNQNEELNSLDNNDQLRKIFGTLSNNNQLKFYSRDPIFMNVPTLFMSCRILKSVDYYDENYRILEDQVLILKILMAGHRIGHLTKDTVKYRRHEGTVQAVLSAKFNKDIRMSFKEYRRLNLSLFNFKDVVYIVDFHMYNLVLYLKIKKLYFFAKVLNRLRPLRIFNISSWS